MKMSEFKYNLPQEKIAKFPPKERGTTKLLVVDRETGDISHKNYSDIAEYIKQGDVIVLNETKVEKRRTFFQTEKGRTLEVLFLNHTEDGNWDCLIKGGKYVEDGDILKDEEIEIQVVGRKDNGFLVRPLNMEAEDIFEKVGHTPIPPYMKREDIPDDYIRYNTVFARLEGSVAAPTASLNLTNEILAQIQKKGGNLETGEKAPHMHHDHYKMLKDKHFYYECKSSQALNAELRQWHGANAEPYLDKAFDYMDE